MNSLTTEDPAFFRRPIKNVSIIGKKTKKGVLNILRRRIRKKTKKGADDDRFKPMGSFEIVGQGAIGFKFIPSTKQEHDKMTFKLAPKDPGQSLTCLFFTIDTDGARLNRGTNAGPDQEFLFDFKDTTIINQGHCRTFWMSIDKENHIIRCGKGYLMKSLQLFEVIIDKDEWNTTGYGNLVDYSMSAFAQDNKVQLITSKYPIYDDLPPLVKSQDEITLDDLDQNTAITIYELSPECRRLYSNVAGKNVQLNTKDFPDFSDAIEYSINTPSMICHTKLKEKTNEFVGTTTTTEPDPKMTYLRITLGANKGDSPGIPYVMEIWPAGYYSPIHDHAQCNAIIKVLSGSLTARYFAGLSPDDTKGPFHKAVVSEGDVTWLDDRQFQTHQLYNHSKDGGEDGLSCVTIQCYLYNDNDNSHYENFDYSIGGDDKIYQFVPGSDWDLDTFKEIIRKEWTAYLLTKTPFNFRPVGNV